MTDLAVPEDLELLALDARAAYALADAKYDRLIEAVDAENRRRMSEVHKILRAIGQGKRYSCGNYRQLEELKLFYEQRSDWRCPGEAIPGNVKPACPACQRNSHKISPHWHVPARIHEGRFQAKIRGRWRDVPVYEHLAADDTIYFPRRWVTPKMSLEFAVQPSIRFRPELRMPTEPPRLEPYPPRVPKRRG